MKTFKKIIEFIKSIFIKKTTPEIQETKTQNTEIRRLTYTKRTDK